MVTLKLVSISSFLLFVHSLDPHLLKKFQIWFKNRRAKHRQACATAKNLPPAAQQQCNAFAGGQSFSMNSFHDASTIPTTNLAPSGMSKILGAFKNKVVILLYLPFTSPKFLLFLWICLEFLYFVLKNKFVIL